MDQQETLGSYLKRERKKRDFSLEQISYATRISIKMLVALEDDLHKELPAQPFVRGYLQAYSKYLKLDPKDILLRYQHHLATNTTNILPSPVHNMENTKSTSPAQKKIILYSVAALALVLSISTFFWLKKKVRVENQYSNVKAPPIKVISPPLPQLSEKLTPEPIKSIEPAPIIPPPMPASTATTKQPIPAPQPIPTPTTAPKEQTTSSVSSQPKAYNLSLTGKEDVWIRYQTDSDEIKDIMVRKDKTIGLQANKIIKIFTGNPKGLIGKLNGAELESLTLGDWKRSIVIPFSEKPNVSLPLFPGSNDTPIKPKEQSTTP